jgi:PBP1b-binding outer membrane lipoprotein LpoB
MMKFWYKYKKAILFVLGCAMILAGCVALIASYRVAVPAVDAPGNDDQDLIDEPQKQTKE